MSAGIFGLWQKQTTLLAEKRYFSETPGIWTDKVTKSQRRPQVTDAELLRKRGHPAVDGFGNLVTNRREDIARILVERSMLLLTPAERAAITPRRKWELVAQLTARRA